MDDGNSLFEVRVKVSDLILELQEFYQTHGDLQVFAYPEVVVTFRSSGGQDDEEISSELGDELMVEIDRYPESPDDVKPHGNAEIARAQICVVRT